MIKMATCCGYLVTLIIFLAKLLVYLFRWKANGNTARHTLSESGEEESKCRQRWLVVICFECVGVANAPTILRLRVLRPTTTTTTTTTLVTTTTIRQSHSQAKAAASPHLRCGVFALDWAIYIARDKGNGKANWRCQRNNITKNEITLH